MTWIRWETATPRSEVVAWLSVRLRVPLAQALGHYCSVACALGEHKPDGRASEVNDEVLEQWAMWREIGSHGGRKPGVFAAAFRERCVDADGYVRGWWRQEALIRKRIRDANKPDGRKKFPPYPPPIPQGIQEGLSGVTDVRTDVRTTTPHSGTTGEGFSRLLLRLPDTGGSRIAVTEFLEAVPHGKSAEWVPILRACLEGLDLPGGRPCTPEQLATTCRDFATKPPHEWTPKFFRTCVAALMRDGAVKGTGSATEPTREAAEAYLRGVT